MLVGTDNRFHQGANLHVVRSRLMLPLLALTLVATACGDDDAPAADGRVEVAAAFYPYAFLVERIGGDAVALSTLTPPGAEPHDLELTARQTAALGETDLVVYARGFQPAVDEAVDARAQDAALDVNDVVELREAEEAHEDGDEHAGEGEDAHGGGDPHLWLDPTRYAEVGSAIAERLTELDPDNATVYAERAEDLTTELTALDSELAAGLKTCDRREIVTSHDAFGYLADRYDLEQIAVTGITPEEEPTPGRLAEVARLAEQRGVTTVFFEELLSSRTAESLAREIGASVEVLNPLEGPPESGDYLTAMRTNLDALRAALGCT